MHSGNLKLPTQNIDMAKSFGLIYNEWMVLAKFDRVNLCNFEYIYMGACMICWTAMKNVGVCVCVCVCVCVWMLN